MPFPPLTATVTVNACAVVMLVRDGVTETVGVVLPIPVPPKVMLCVVLPGAVAFRLLSVRTSEPVRVPAVVGSKLIDNWQEAPAANVPAVGEFVPTSGQAVAPLLSRVKFAAMLGLFPVER